MVFKVGDDIVVYFHTKVAALKKKNPKITHDELEKKVIAGLPSDMKGFVNPSQDLALLRKNVLHAWDKYSDHLKRTILAATAEENKICAANVEEKICVAQKQQPNAPEMEKCYVNINGETQVCYVQSENFKKWKSSKDSNYRYKANDNSNKFKLKCHYCKKVGHKMEDCFKFIKRVMDKQQNKNDNNSKNSQGNN